MKKLLGKSKKKLLSKEKINTEADVIMAPLGTSEYGRLIREIYSETIDEPIVLDDNLEEFLLRYDEIQDTISKLKTEKDVIEHTIMSMMKERDTAYIKNRKITWKKSTRCSIDTKRLKEEEPEIYKQYSKVTTNRLFKIR